MNRLLLYTFALFLFISKLPAEPVDSITAKRVAANFYFQNSDAKSLTVVNSKLVDVATSSDDNNVILYYAFNINNNEGFVIVSADNNINPVLAYSDNGSYNIDDLPPAFINWMKTYDNEITYRKLNIINTEKSTKEKWNLLLSKSQIKLKSSKSSVGPLLTTKWGQGCNYNKQCPADTKGACGHAYAGCVANAMSQIMNYWKYPLHGYGFYSIYDAKYGDLSVNFANTKYDWDNMPASLSASSSPAQIDAVAQLMYHCGVSVDMDYDILGSGVSTIDFVGEKMKKYFNYSNSMKIQKVKWNTDWNAWKNMLKAELDAKRPVLYSGADDRTASGHGFVCDGYNDNDYFHFDWGWSGQLNGYYLITNLNPATYGFNSSQIILTGIQPAELHKPELDLYSDISFPSDTLIYGGKIELQANLINNDTSVFKGRFAAFLFDKLGHRFTIDSSSADVIIEPGMSLQDKITFSSKPIITAAPGKYKLGVYFRNSDGNWALADSSYFKNMVDIYIKAPGSNLLLTSEIKPSVNPIVQNQNFTISSKLHNCGDNFSGTISFVIYNEAGDSITTIWSKSGASIDNLMNDSVFSPDLNLDLSPGKYFIAVLSKCNFNGTSFINPGNYSNPLMVRIVPAPLLPDIFEKNDAESKASVLTVDFTDNLANVNTSGSNIDHSIDIDFYKIDLPSGYSYTVTATMHDKDNSKSGEDFTTNMLFSYKDSSKYSGFYDDSSPVVIKLNDGGVVYFEVFAFTWGQTGTYRLDLNIKRISKDAVNDIEKSSANLEVYPVPANNLLNIDLTHEQGKEADFFIYNNIGKLVLTGYAQTFPAQLEISDLCNGIYFLDILSNNKTYRKKFIINR